VRALRFVKPYADLASAIQTAVEAYVADVRERRFPQQHAYWIPEEELEALEAALADRATLLDDARR